MKARTSRLAAADSMRQGRAALEAEQRKSRQAPAPLPRRRAGSSEKLMLTLLRKWGPPSPEPTMSAGCKREAGGNLVEHLPSGRRDGAQTKRKKHKNTQLNLPPHTTSINITAIQSIAGALKTARACSTLLPPTPGRHRVGSGSECPPRAALGTMRQKIGSAPSDTRSLGGAGVAKRVLGWRRPQWRRPAPNAEKRARRTQVFPN